MEEDKNGFEVTITWHPCDPDDPNTWPKIVGKYLISTMIGSVSSLWLYDASDKVIAKYFGYGRDAEWPADVKKIITAWAEYPAPYVDPEFESIINGT